MPTPRAAEEIGANPYRCDKVEANSRKGAFRLDWIGVVGASYQILWPELSSTRPDSPHFTDHETEPAIHEELRMPAAHRMWCFWLTLTRPSRNQTG